MASSDARVQTTAEASSRRVEIGGVGVLTWPFLEARGVEAVVTERTGGVSNGPFSSLNLALHVGDHASSVLENRRRALATLGAGLDDLVLAEQVHQDRVAVVGRGDRGRGARSVADAVPRTDALVTVATGVVLGILVADCAPVVLFDPDERVLGAAHAGWRGTLGGVVEATVAAMSSLGARADRLLGAIGPTVAAHRYQVGDDVVAAARHRLGAGTSALVAGTEGAWHFDLRAALDEILARVGVARERIASAPCDSGPPSFFSARAASPCGRFGLFARITP